MKIQKTVRFRHFEFSLALGVFLILFQNCSQIGSIKVTSGTLSSESLSQITPVTETPSAINPVNPTIDPQMPASLAAGNVQIMPCTDRTSNFHEIRSVADFNYWAPLAEPCNVFSLLNDIDFKGQELTPFNLNQSFFIGNNFKIFNYSIHYLVKKNQYNVSVGTFSTLQSSMIAGLKVADFKIYVTQEDLDTQPYQTASLVGNLNNSSIINSSASDGLIETVNNVWFIGGLVGRSCGNSEVHSSWSRVHINVKSSTNSPANAYNVSGLVGGFPCGNSVNIISNSFSSSVMLPQSVLFALGGRILFF